jgi:hypothetical protein
MVMKQSPTATVGIGFTNNRGKLVISSIAEDGIFAHSLLNVSDTCLSINGTKCTSDMDASAAVALIRASPAFVTITAKTRHETGVVVAASAVSTPTIVSNTTGANGSTPFATAATHQEGPTVSQKKGCICAIGIFAIMAIIIVFVVSGNRGDANDYSCTYIFCDVCTYSCFSKSCFCLPMN